MGFVINDNGARLGDVKRGFASACRHAGLAGVSPHTLRHTCATWLMQRGVPKWEVSGFLAMTEETLERVTAITTPTICATLPTLCRVRGMSAESCKISGLLTPMLNEKRNKIVHSRGGLSSPKAEVVSSNLAGRAMFSMS
jgi:hypothetical protein